MAFVPSNGLASTQEVEVATRSIPNIYGIHCLAQLHKGFNIQNKGFVPQKRVAADCNEIFTFSCMLTLVMKDISCKFFKTKAYFCFAFSFVCSVCLLCESILIAAFVLLCLPRLFVAFVYYV